MSGGGPQHRPGVAQFVVERAGRRDDLAERGEHRGQQILGGRLARRPRDTDDRQPARHQLGGDGGGQLGERAQHRRTRAVRVVLEHAGTRISFGANVVPRGHHDGRDADRSGGQHRHRARRHRGGRVVVPVGTRARQGEEQPARRHRAGVELDGAGHPDAVRRRQRTRRRVRHRPRRRSGPASGRSRAVPQRLERTGEFGAVVERPGLAVTRLADFVALARDQHHVTGPRPADGEVDGGAPVADLDELGGGAAPQTHRR